MYTVAIFASGSGTNAENLIQSFADTDIHVSRVYCNNKNAGVIERANRLQVPVCVFNKSDMNDTNDLLDLLIRDSVDFIILSGFLWLLPTKITDLYKDRILNIHPALLPNYGGKGMFGHHVHEAVLANKEQESGITIHLVNELYDSGKTLFQASCPVLSDDTPDSLAARVHALEYEHFPRVVSEYVHSYK